LDSLLAFGIPGSPDGAVVFKLILYDGVEDYGDFATVVMPHATNQSASCCKSSVKVAHTRTG
jgi:hypothetical protein